jgi:cysteine-rich repeat protein
MEIRVRRFAALLLVAAGCLDSPLVPCGDLFCGPGSVCVSNMCAAPADVTACDGMPDGASCKASNGGAGTCQGGVCQTGLCGNGKLDVGEACDDGNQVSGDGCRGDCLKIEVCGDGQLDVGEQCDDGNHNAADGCDMCKKTVWNVSTAVGSEIAGPSATLANPHGLATDSAGRVFVADTFNHRILRVDADGGVTQIAGNGTPGYSGDGGDATSAQLQDPADVAVDGIGRVFIADSQNATIRRIELDGSITTIAGTGVGGYSGDGGPAVLAQLANPSAVAVDGLGNVLIADSDNNVIRRIDIDGTINTIAGTGVASYSGDGGQALNATFSEPQGLVVDASGRVIVADTANSVVRRIDTTGVITTVAGNGTSGSTGDGGQATAALLSFPVAVAVDASGQIFIADTFNQRIRKIGSTGVITTIAGTGTDGYGGDGGPATAAMLSSPFGVAVDAQGQVAICDTSNERIRRIDTTGSISSIAGNGTYGFGGDGDMATSAQISDPFQLATDAMGRVYITDTNNNRIRRIELDGTITTVAGTGLYGFTGDGGPATKAELAKANGVAVDATGRVFIADTYNHRIRMVDAAGIITTIAGDGTTAVLQNPNGVALDGNGGVVIADTYNHRVRRLDLAAGTLTTIAGNGSFGYGGDNALATAAVMSFPYEVAVDSTGRVIFGDTSNNRVRAFTVGGNITTIAGTGVAGLSGDGGLATAAKIDQPYGVTLDLMNRVVFCDWNNHRIRRIETNGTITTIAGTVQGSSGDAAAATSAQLSFPIGVIYDANGILSIADTNNERIRKLDPTTGILTTIAGKVDPNGIGPAMKGRLADPQAVAVTPSLTVVAGGTSGTVEAIRAGTVTVVAGRYPQSAATGTLARYRTAAFGAVGGVAIDQSSNTIYVAETSSNRLHVVDEVNPADPSSWTITTLANTAGTAGFADGAAATAQFRGPTGLYLDVANHTLYIADTGNHAIRALDLQSKMVTTVVNTSHSLGFGGDGGAATAALLYRPTALTRCPNGDLFIADTGNNRIRRVTSGTISTVLGDGVAASSGEGTPARTFPVDAPRGAACDAAGNLFVTSATAVRLLPDNDSGIVDGSGAVQTVYGAPPRTMFPSSVTDCLTGIAVVGPTTLQVADACTGLLVQLDRVPAP